jgi:hypothetical protein
MRLSWPGQWAVILELPSVETSKDGYVRRIEVDDIVETATESGTVRDILIKMGQGSPRNKNAHRSGP